MLIAVYGAFHGKTTERTRDIYSTNWRDERRVRNIIRKLSEVIA
jgi:hypothetical protein